MIATKPHRALPPAAWGASSLVLIQAFLDRVAEHGVWLRAHGGLERKARERARLRFESLLAEAALRQAKARAGSDKVEDAIQRIADRTLDPYTAVADLLGQA